jgi:flavodoxin
MKTSIVYASYTGTTRGIAEQIQAALGGDLIEVRSKEYSSRLSAYTIGCFRAVQKRADRIEPAEIDVSSSDIVVIGTPVWAGKPTPAINGAVAALRGCAGKPAVIFATCGKNPGETLGILSRALIAKGMTVAGQFAFQKTDPQNPEAVGPLLSEIRKIRGAP